MIGWIFDQVRNDKENVAASTTMSSMESLVEMIDGSCLNMHDDE